MHRGKAIGGHSEGVAVCKPSREAPGQTKPSDTLSLDFQPPELWENKLLLSKVPSLWYLVLAAQQMNTGKNTMVVVVVLFHFKKFLY